MGEKEEKGGEEEEEEEEVCSLTRSQPKGVQSVEITRSLWSVVTRVTPRTLFISARLQEKKGWTREPLDEICWPLRCVGHQTRFVGH